jgi:hypothetical protein
MEHDGKEMKLIANVSSNVAITTAKDSAAMKIIADVTMFFLPATFIAVRQLLFVDCFLYLHTSDTIQLSILQVRDKRPRNKCLSPCLDIRGCDSGSNSSSTRDMVFFVKAARVQYPEKLQ